MTKRILSEKAAATLTGTPINAKLLAAVVGTVLVVAEDVVAAISTVGDWYVVAVSSKGPSYTIHYVYTIKRSCRLTSIILYITASSAFHPRLAYILQGCI